MNLSDTRKVLEFHREISNDSSDFYRLDRIDISGYFSLNPKFSRRISDYFQELHNQNKKVVHLDICGRASGISMGADKSYLFSLKIDSFKRIIANSEDILIEGDIFNSNDFSKFLNIVKSDGYSPALITFVPVAGLQDYYPGFNEDVSNNYAEITYGLLEKRLKECVAVLPVGGLIFFEKPFQMMGLADFLQRKQQNQYEMSMYVKKQARRLKCKVEINSDLGGPYFLLQKSR